MKSNHKNIFIFLIIFLILILAGIIFSERHDPKNVKYIIDGKQVEGRYFGNEYKTDLNNDGREDVVSLITQDPGGSGIFYYVVAAIKTDGGYIGSDGYFLGDRIAPQTIEISKNPRHKNVIVVNYADRSAGEPMTTQPTISKSIYLKLDAENMMWGIVEPDFEGESL